MENQSIKNFPRYERYKDSGVDWFERIPADWDVKPIRAIFSERNERNTKSQVDFILSVTRDRGVIPYDEKGAIGNNKSENIENYKIVHPHDLVINKMNVVIGSLGLSKYHGALSHIYIVLKPMTDEVSILFYSYVFHNPLFYKSLIRYCKGIMELRESLDQTEFKKIRLPFPPLLEQTAIAQFLDHKTAQIGRAIAIKEAQIKLLNERKQIMIQEAVTKGLDPTVKMKDSGVEWIGEIPEHWDRIRAGYAYKIILGKMVQPHKKRWDEVEIPYLNSQNVQNGYVDLSLVRTMFGTKNDLNAYQIKGNDLLVCEGGDVARSALVKNDMPDYIIQNALHLVRATNLGDTGYLHSLLQVVRNSGYMSVLVNKATIAHFTKDKFSSLKIVLPPYEEQLKITQKLYLVDTEIAQAVQVYQNQIHALKEYKTTLINEAVTGKIKVN